jgi:erythronate-4-phosphate dehydrogenase
MKIVIDDKIPYIRGAFEPYADVLYLSGPATTASVVKDAAAIVTRTRTNCNKELLDGSSVKIIATATIGFDHIDTDYCEGNGIRWTNAPGCNSKSVEQYIASALMVWAEKQERKLSDCCIGIIGVGNVGSKVARISELLGMKVLLNDPPRARREQSGDFVDISVIQQEADIITLHVPLETAGEDPTYHLINPLFVNGLKKQALLINSCRGEVTDTSAVKLAVQAGQIAGFVADCWENEPDIDRELMEMCFLATPHIAGYSKDGKATGTRMSVQSISRFLGMELNNWEPAGIEPPLKPVLHINGKGLSDQEIVARAILHSYDIRDDDTAFRSKPEAFEQLRGDYPVRREFPAYTIKAENIPPSVLNILSQLGFRIDGVH